MPGGSRDLQLQGKGAGTDGTLFYIVGGVLIAVPGRLFEPAELIGADDSQPALPGIRARFFFLLRLCPEPVRQDGQGQFRPASVCFAVLQAQKALSVIGSDLMQIPGAAAAEVDRPQDLVRCVIPAAKQGQDIAGGFIDRAVRVGIVLRDGLFFFFLAIGIEGKW